MGLTSNNIDDLIFALLSTPWDPAAQTTARRLLQSSPDGEIFFLKIIRERINDLICQNLQQTGLASSLPPALWHKIQLEFQAATARQALLQHELKKLLEQTEQIGLPVMVIKGGALARLRAARVMDDLDIVVAKADLAKIKAVLGQSGFREDPDYDNLFSKSNQVKFDVHTDVFSLARLPALKYFVQVDEAEIWRQSFPYNDRFTFARVPSPLDHLALIIYHIQKHRFLSLSPLMDLALLLYNKGAYLDWNELLAKVAQYNLNSPLRITFRFLADCLRFPFPPGVQQKLVLGRFEQHLLVRLKHGQKLSQAWSLLPVISIKGFSRKLSFLRAAAFPRDRQIMAQATGTKSRLLAPVIRFFQLAKYALTQGL